MLIPQRPIYEQVESVKQQGSWEELVSQGLELRASTDQSQWNLGDLALQIEKSYGVDSLSKFAIEININKNSLQQYRRVSKAYPSETRSPILSHRHHLILAGRDDRFEMLKKCELENITTSQLEMMQSRNPQKEMIKKEVLVCQHCQKLIVKPSNVCTCTIH
jgi:hypothetical protein